MASSRSELGSTCTHTEPPPIPVDHAVPAGLDSEARDGRRTQTKGLPAGCETGSGAQPSQPAAEWQVALRVGEGHLCPLDQIPISGRATEAWCADLLLPVGVGQWIGGASGQGEAFQAPEKYADSLNVR